MKVVSNCPLCGKKALHVMGESHSEIQQCINCGYSTTSKFVGKKDDNKQYKNMTDEMKNWSKEANGRIWIPAMMTLPFGMLYPFDDEKGSMKWGFAEMVDIPEDEQENYPREDGNGFYNRRYDTENSKVFDEFVFAMAELNEKMKNAQENNI
jgi:Zn ribbon nucleic-acid-binding protein